MGYQVRVSPTGAGFTAFDTIADLAAFPTAPLVSGLLVYVSSPKSFWQLDPTSTETPDPPNNSVVAATGGGNWLLRDGKGLVATVSVLAFGAVADAETLTDGVLVTGTPNLTTLASTPFKASDVGKSIMVLGANSAAYDGNLRTTILAYVAPNAVTLAANGLGSVSGVIVDWGTDNTPAFQHAVNAVSSANGTLNSPSIALGIPAGSYLITSAVPQGWGINVSAGHITIVAAPGAKLVSIVAADSSGTIGSTFYADFLLDGSYSTLLLAPVVIGTSTFQVGVKPNVGDLLQLVTAGVGNQFAAYYTVRSVAGAASPFTVTADRPIMAPFAIAGTNTTTVNRVTNQPTNFRLEGHGLVMTGTGSRYIEVWGGLRCQVSDVWFDESGGNLYGGSYANSFDEGSKECYWIRCHADLPSASYAFLCEGLGENNGIIDCWSARTVLGSFQLAINYASVVRGCRSEGGGSEAGVWIGAYNDEPVVATSIGCSVVGGSFTGSGSSGVIIDSAIGTIVDDVQADANVSAGVTVNPLAVGTIVTNSAMRFNANYGLHVQAGATGTRYSNIDVTGNVNYGINAAADLSGDRCYGVPGGLAASGSTWIASTAGRQIHRNVDLGISDTGARTALNLSGNAECVVTGIARMSGGGTFIVVGITLGGGSKCCVYDFQMTGASANSIGLNPASGTTLRLGQNVDVDLTATPLNVGGYCSKSIVGAANAAPIVANGASAVDVTWPDLKTSDRVTLSLLTKGGTPGDPQITYTPGTKFTLTSFAGDTSTYHYVVQ